MKLKIDKYNIKNKVWNVSTNDEFNGIKSVEIKRLNNINELARNNKELLEARLRGSNIFWAKIWIQTKNWIRRYLPL